MTILGAIAIGVVEAFKVGPKSNIGRGLFIIITYAATIFDKMLIAGAASILARGIIQDAAACRCSTASGSWRTCRATSSRSSRAGV